jgi:small subunit ribosomal protein S1
LAKLREVISKGQEIVAKVIKVDQEYKKISLSIKEYLVEKNKENHDDIVVGEKKKRTTKKKTKDKEEEGTEGEVVLSFYF